MRKKSKGGGEPIETWDGIFADPEVGRVLKARWLIADANQSSIEELSQITTLNPGSYASSGCFYNNTVITKFPELKYCTGLTDLRSTFYGCSSLVEAPIIPDSVTSMYETFRGCSSLVDAPIIPEGVTDMSHTFHYCSSLVDTPTIPEGVTKISSTFHSCSSLVDAPIIPEGVTSMYATFLGCTSLVNAPTIPEGVTDIRNTFNNCTNLDGVFVIKPVTPPTYSTTFKNVNVVAIYVPDNRVNTYKSRTGWSGFSSKIYPMSELPE